MAEINEDDLIVFRTLADRALVTDPGYVIPKLADAVHRLLAEVERLKPVEAAAHRGARMPETRWRMLQTSGHLWGWGALAPEEKARNGTPARISPADSDRIVDAALGRIRELMEMWFEDGHYHHCSGCGARGPLRHEGSIYICADCNASGVKVVDRADG
jgi:hypothetical protein